MKISIRTKFALGMLFVFCIILALIGFSSFFLIKLSKKTNAILEDNYVSVVYAREMSDGLINISNEMHMQFLEKREPDVAFIRKELKTIDEAFQKAKNNITEPGEDKLIAEIESGITDYKSMLENLWKSKVEPGQLAYLQKKSGILYQQTSHLFQMNGRAIEAKSESAAVSSKNAITQMTILGSLCFLISFSFIYSFASYFNERFLHLFNGIKEIISNNYGQRIYFEGNDEFSEISVAFNQMAEKLDTQRKQTQASILFDVENKEFDNNSRELKNILVRIKAIQSQAEDLLSRMAKNGKE